MAKEIARRAKLLINGARPMVFLPELAMALGSTDSAIILQQLHWLLRESRNGITKGGHRWVYNTYEGWQQHHFPWLSVRSVQRIILDLEKEGILLSCQPEGRFSRRKYYRIDYGVFDRLEKSYDVQDLCPENRESADPLAEEIEKWSGDHHP